MQGNKANKYVSFYCSKMTLSPALLSPVAEQCLLLSAIITASFLILLCIPSRIPPSVLSLSLMSWRASYFLAHQSPH